MKSLLAVALALAVTPAAAKPSPVEFVHSANPVALARASAEFNIRPAGAPSSANIWAPETDSTRTLSLPV